MITDLANVALVAAGLGCFVFVALYHALADWRATPLGRNVMAFMLVAGILITLSVLRNLVRIPDDVLPWLRLVSFTVVAVIVWHRVYLLYRAQRAAEHEESTR